MQNWPAKDRDAVLDYTYTIPLDAGDAVASYNLEKLTGDVVIDSESRTGAVLTVWLSGGTDGETAFFRITWSTTAGRDRDDLISISINDQAAQASGYVRATSESLKAAFGKFAAVADVAVEFWLSRARRMVDDSWCADDRQMGEMLLAAHYMTTEGLGTGTEAQLAADGLASMQSIRSGQLALTKADASATDAAGSLGSTTYGQRFLELMMQNRAGPRVAPTGTLPDALLYEPLYYVGSG